MFVEDLDAFFADFGVAGTLAGQPVRVIYDSPFIFEPLGGNGIGATSPQATIKSSSVPASVFGAALVIPQGSFTVREAQPDGTGITRLQLTAA